MLSMSYTYLTGSDISSHRPFAKNSVAGIAASGMSPTAVRSVNLFLCVTKQGGNGETSTPLTLDLRLGDPNSMLRRRDRGEYY